MRVNVIIVTMTIWQPDLTGHRGPRYLAIVDALAEDIRHGKIKPGDRLPTHRDLAYELGVTVGTVSRAYAQAAQRGLTTGEVGRGTFVAGEAHSSPAYGEFYRRGSSGAGVVDFGLNMPAPGRRAAALRACLKEIADSPQLDDLLSYETNGGLPAHRETAARWIGETGHDVAPDNLVICSGAQHALTSTLMALTRPGDCVAAEALTYPATAWLAMHLGVKLEPVQIDEQGLIPDAFEEVCRTRAPKALYAIPTLHNPTTANLPEDRRRAIAGIARKYDVAIIDDDVYGYLMEDGPLPLASFAPERSYHISGASKCLAPGLRIGYVAAPPDGIEQVRNAVSLTTWMAPTLTSEIAYRWISDGTADRLVDWHRTEARARQALASSILPAGSYQTKPYSYHLWLKLGPERPAELFVEQARQAGVVVIPLARFAVGRTKPEEAVRVCLGSPDTRELVEVGLKRLTELLGQAPAPVPVPELERPVF